MLIAVPYDAPGGLDSTISEHFGHCGAFTIVTVANGKIGEVSILENSGHEQGGCMAPVQLLKQEGVEVLVAGGMGQRPLSGFQQVGIAVHFKEDARSVSEAIELFLKGGCRSFGEAQTCGGGGGGCGGHHHEEVVREPIEGVADIREGRVVTLDFELTHPLLRRLHLGLGWRGCDGDTLDDLGVTGRWRGGGIGHLSLIVDRFVDGFGTRRRQDKQGQEHERELPGMHGIQAGVLVSQRW